MKGWKRMTSKKKKTRKLLSILDIQREYLSMDSRKLRAFLNSQCNYKKIGKTYYYSRAEVESLLLSAEKVEYEINPY